MIPDGKVFLKRIGNFVQFRAGRLGLKGYFKVFEHSTLRCVAYQFYYVPINNEEDRKKLELPCTTVTFVESLK